MIYFNFKKLVKVIIERNLLLCTVNSAQTMRKKNHNTWKFEYFNTKLIISYDIFLNYI